MAAFPAVRIEGGLLGPEILDQLLAGELPGQRPADFRLDARRNLTDEIAAAFADARAFVGRVPAPSGAARRGRSGNDRDPRFLGGSAVQAARLRAAIQSAGAGDRRPELLGLLRADEGEDAPPVHIERMRCQARPAGSRHSAQLLTRADDALLYRKGPGQLAKLAYLGHVLMENRHGLVVDTRLTLATGTAEREAALDMAAARPGNHRITLAADKAYDAAGFIADLREYNVTPHVAQNTTNRRSAIDGRTTRHPGYTVSGRVRKRIEEVFGWTKAAAGFRKTSHRGVARVGWMFTLTATAYNLVRLRKLMRAVA